MITRANGICRGMIILHHPLLSGFNGPKVTLKTDEYPVFMNRISQGK